MDLTGIKCVALVLFSTTTIMESCFLDIMGNLMMESIDISSHFHSVMGKVCSSPTGCWCYALLEIARNTIFVWLSPSSNNLGLLNIILDAIHQAPSFAIYHDQNLHSGLDHNFLHAHNCDLHHAHFF